MEFETIEQCGEYLGTCSDMVDVSYLTIIGNYSIAKNIIKFINIIAIIAIIVLFVKHILTPLMFFLFIGFICLELIWDSYIDWSIKRIIYRAKINITDSLLDRCTAYKNLDDVYKKSVRRDMMKKYMGFSE